MTVSHHLRFWATVCKNGSPYAIGSLSVLSVCLSVCLSVTLVYCGQTVRWINMPLGMAVGLGPGHIVLDGDPPLHSERSTAAPTSRPCLLWPNGRPSQLLLSSFNSRFPGEPGLAWFACSIYSETIPVAQPFYLLAALPATQQTMLLKH